MGPPLFMVTKQCDKSDHFGDGRPMESLRASLYISANFDWVSLTDFSDVFSSLVAVWSSLSLWDAGSEALPHDVGEDEGAQRGICPQ